MAKVTQLFSLNVLTGRETTTETFKTLFLLLSNGTPVHGKCQMLLNNNLVVVLLGWKLGSRVTNNTSTTETNINQKKRFEIFVSQSFKK